MSIGIFIVEDEFIVANDLRHVLHTAGYEVSGIAATGERALELILATKPAFVFLDIKLGGQLTGIDLAVRLKEMDIPFLFISANFDHRTLQLAKATDPYGFLVKPFKDDDVLVSLDIAIYRHEHNLEARLGRERRLQEEVSRIMGARISWKEQVVAMLSALAADIPFDYCQVYCKNTGFSGREFMGFYKGDKGDIDFLSLRNLAQKLEESVEVLSGGFSDHESVAGLELQDRITQEFGFGSSLVCPIAARGKESLLYSFYTVGPNSYQQEHRLLIGRLSPMLTGLAEHILNDGAVLPKTPGNDRHILHSRKKDEPVATIDSSDMGMIGVSSGLAEIKKQIAIVAPYDISVLVLGESGTGKERAAQAIHRLSARSGNAFVKINCGAIPAALMESELFGHEKGAFTGAAGRRIGKFEQAAGGTIFLDEIGELSADLQAKLLCVLQEKEIVRLGSNETIKTDVRIIAATNRDLEREVACGRFRLDLYFRLKVFPITLLPLRDRKEDIALLVPHILQQLSRKLDRPLTNISEPMYEQFQQYDWPGNIRELENLLERSALLSTGPVLSDIIMPDELAEEAAVSMAETEIKTMREAEKAHILAALRKCNDRINGVGGAAELLDMAPTTLLTKMNKLGIVKKFIAD